MHFPLGHLLDCLLQSKIPLSPRRIGINRQPDNAFAGIFLLQLLHVAAAVMFVHEWTFRIKPLEYDIFAFVLRKRMRVAVGIGE